MKMRMHYSLPCCSPVVPHQIGSITLKLTLAILPCHANCEFRRKQGHVHSNVFGHVYDILVVLSWNNQDMSSLYWVDIHDNSADIIFIHLA